MPGERAKRAALKAQVKALQRTHDELVLRAREAGELFAQAQQDLARTAGLQRNLNIFDAPAIIRSEPRPATSAEYRAIERAENLLLAHLSPEQRAEWRKAAAFHVKGSQGGVYRLSREPRNEKRASAYYHHRFPYVREHTVTRIQRSDGKDFPHVCVNTFIASPYDVPQADNILAQKLLLETDEARFDGMACYT